MIVIAIDGPAASGKSSVSRALAGQLGFFHVNSGSMYRAITWEMLRQGVDTSCPSAIGAALERFTMVCGISEDGESFIRINGETPDAALRDIRVNRHVSPVSAVPAVRDLVTKQLHALARDRRIVVEGRDIGSVVFPETPYKFYLDASPGIRRKRREAEGGADEIEARDKMDSSRQTAPLVIAHDACVVDTSHLPLDGVVDAVLAALGASGLITGK